MIGWNKLKERLLTAEPMGGAWPSQNPPLGPATPADPGPAPPQLTHTTWEHKFK